MESPVLLRTCHICVKIFQNQKEYEEHRNLVHKKNQREICKHCGKTFSHKYYLNTHINLVHSQSPDQGKCNQCEETFENHYKLTIHKRQKHTERIFSCEYCPLTFTLVSHKDTHIRRHHLKLKDFACDKCDYKGFSVHYLRVHIIQKHSDFRPYKCHLCPMAFSRVASLYQHRGTHENALKKTKDFSCPICGKAFVNKKGSERCNKRHQSEGVKCSSDDCDTTFTSKCLMKKHLKESHTDSQKTTEKDIHICFMCDKSFKYKADRNRHVTHVHEKLEATISCKLCPKKFINKVRLERHQLTHNGNVFKCTFEGCTSSRNTKYSLSHHFQQKHAKVNHRKSLEERLAAEREKNQKLLCDLCKIWIKQKSMAVHLKTHENKTTMNCIVGDCLEEIYFTRDKSSHTYNLPSQFYEHLTKQHEVDLNKKVFGLNLNALTALRYYL